MDTDNYVVYVKTDDNGHIVAVNSSAFLSDTTGWTEIDQGSGDKYHHAQGNYFSEPILTLGGAWCYKLVDGMPTECTADEIAEQEAANQPDISSPTQDERITALETENAMLTAQIGAMSDQLDFYEDCIAEMAGVVYA